MDPSGDSTCANAQQNARGRASAPDTTTFHEAIDALQRKIHLQNDRGWRRIVLNFTPSWFAVIMGTGISSILLHNLPYNGVWIYWLSIVIFCFNIILFLTFTIISVLRYTMFLGLFEAMIRHPVQSLFLGTFPMGLATIINMFVFACVPHFGPWATTLAWTLWWIDSAIALSTCLYLPFVLIHVHQNNDLSKMTAVWLLPIVATIVASATGGVVAEVLPKPQHAFWTVIVSYILWGTGFPMAMIVIAIYMQRLTMHQLPPREVIVSVFLPLGPLGQGSFALMQLGKCALRVFPKVNAFTTASEVADIFNALGLLCALVLWGFGLVWLFFALASISRSKFPFNMGWWGFTFPLGVYAVATCTLGENMQSGFFKGLGTAFSIIVVLLWLMVGFETAKRAVSGQIFLAPCVNGYEREVAVRLIEKERQVAEENC